MMGRRNDKMRTADEYDALTSAKRLYKWLAGKRRAIKAQFRRRERRIARDEARLEKGDQ